MNMLTFNQLYWTIIDSDSSNGDVDGLRIESDSLTRLKTGKLTILQPKE